MYFLYFGPFIPRDEPVSLWWEVAEAKTRKYYFNLTSLKSYTLLLAQFKELILNRKV